MREACKVRKGVISAIMKISVPIPRMRKILPRAACAALLIPALLGHAWGFDERGRDLLLGGNSPASLGAGLTGIASPGLSYFSVNPASIAAAERFALSTAYGGVDGDMVYPALAAAYPTAYGSFGFAFSGISVPGSPDIEKAYSFSLGGAKRLTRNLQAGLAVSGVSMRGPGGNGTYPGASLGFVYGVPYRTGGGFGIYDPALALSGRVGPHPGGLGDTADLNTAGAGYRMGFYKNDILTISFMNEMWIFGNVQDRALRFGLEALLFGNWALRTGMSLPNELSYGSFTMGAGYRLESQAYAISLDYAMAYHRESDFAHYVGLSLQFGELDREPPRTGITASDRYMSPNFDGSKDYVRFATVVRDRSAIKGWRLQITAQDGALVREYRISDRDMEESASPFALLGRIVRTQESMIVPESILWDGTDSKGRTVPDGRYDYAFIVWDEFDNISKARTGSVIVDNTAPAIELKAADLLFSPNGDGRKDELVVEQVFSSAPADEWHAVFADASGRAVRSFTWKGDAIPAMLSWDGKDDAGADAPEGIYTLAVESRDGADNAVKRTLKNISLTRAFESADITASLEYFSIPLQREMKFFLSLSKTEGLDDWRVIIADKEGKPLREFFGAAFENLVAWDGRDAGGTPLANGKYFYSLRTRFASGNAPASFTKELVLDGTAPDISIKFSPSPFSPDADGENDTLVLRPGLQDETGIDDWRITIFSAANEPFKQFRGKGIPAREIVWDGLSEKNEVLESAVDYFIEFEAVDLAGNRARAPRLKLPVDVLVMVTERGLKIRISNIEFAFDSAGLTPGARPILNRVVDILEKYENYFVLVEGHTDDIGEEEYNIRLSEDRAKSVMDYLVDKGIDKKRLTFRGMGETAPFLPNTSAENQRRNRRVEFLLKKKETQ
ncbi:MAG: hypothetical protein EPN93_09215 [Spirochaetes bacterium]|nr:MAG: hypothetical protein EPN93_09215 [Spirochaetota bacterium]